MTTTSSYRGAMLLCAAACGGAYAADTLSLIHI